ncbi:35329_t:CDS:2 [Gigaspora margarita]|uniref:35329_t:CDS:1 n=1 Tax=Gigaspora margarita TaxID=4874 RepID=A0ABM8W3U3_GIGMA|nr:35329_t:CDS:2 [Gigaspora margarita]
MANFKEIFRPFINLFSCEQLQAVLLAWLPSKLEPYFSGIIAFRSSLIVQIEYYVKGIYGTKEKNLLYEALSWIISQQTKELDNGSFIVQPANNKKGCKFNIVYKLKENDNNNNQSYSQPQSYYYKEPDLVPSIFLSVINNNSSPNNKLDVNAITKFISEVMSSYFKTKEKNYKHARYKRNEGNWNRVQLLSDLNGLKTVVLDEPKEKLLKKELGSFVNDKEFYKKIGLPYRCGFLLYGKPRTGKTTLINAISSYLSRDLYYLNLKEIKNNNDMSAAFSFVPPNQIIVLEDVDTQSNILYKRGVSHPNYNNFISEDFIKENDDLSKYKDLLSFISLSNFLGCLDGQILSEGTLIIITTNHIEHLDPACIRPGRMNMHLNLEYCTHYQISKMYQNVTNKNFPINILKKIPDRILPPCDVMITMISHRNDYDLIPNKILELAEKYQLNK